MDERSELIKVLKGETSHFGGRAWMLDQVGQRCQALIETSSQPVRACGVSFGGPVDFKRQLVTSVHTPGWEKAPLAEWLCERLRLPCRLDNDANCGALGEYRFGAGRSARSMIYVTLSTGIGSGIVIDGKVERGRDSMAGEIGHLPLSDLDVACTCGGKGCLEALASGRAIARQAREVAELHPREAARLLGLSGGNAARIRARDVFQAAAEGDGAAGALVREATQWLARGLVMAIRLINPDRIILGGGMAEAGDTLLHPVRQQLNRWRSTSFPFSTEIVKAELGDDSPLYGAASLARELLQGNRQET